MRLFLVLLLSFLTVSSHAADDVQTLAVGQARIHLLIEEQPFSIGRDELQAWVLRSAGIVAQYYDGFPVNEVHVAIRGRQGDRVFFGQALGGNAGAVVNVIVGLNVDRETLDDDWVLIHELIHLAFPIVPRRHHWIEEGLSTYVESIARANTGALNDEIVWQGFVDSMHYGLPKPGDQGLDNTATWGRTYWGGALFCLLADVRIRQATEGQKSLRDALRGIVAAGYDISQTSKLRPVLEAGDKATGVEVLTQLYDEMRDRPWPVSLDSTWADLGITESEGKVRFVDEAPLSNVRHAITARSANRTIPAEAM
jgi:hypothetical protein